MLLLLLLFLLLLLLGCCGLCSRRDWGEVEGVADLSAARGGDPDLGLLLLLLLLLLGQLVLDGRPPRVLVGIGKL